jgi:uncharacterized protein (DUF2236 family)
MSRRPRDEVPPEVRASIAGLGLAAGGANVIMQLSRLPIGHGVARSTVESGQVHRHPVKRLRTTTAFLVISLFGTPDERRLLRTEINRVHEHVHSQPGDPVVYDAFDPELQLWVAACLLQGALDIDARLHGTGRPEVVYDHLKRFGTDLQVSDDLWPADLDGFERYWDEGVRQIEIDDLTRAYLTTIADGSFLLAPLGRWGRPLTVLLRPWNRFMTLGFLPAPFRHELGLPWSDGQQRRHDRLFGALFTLARRSPRPIREFPLNLYLRDTRRRLRDGRPVI